MFKKFNSELYVARYTMNLYMFNNNLDFLSYRVQVIQT
jgi:hypothetical protein